MLRTALLTTAIAAALVAANSAQSRNRDNSRAFSCSDRHDTDDRATHCEMREDTIGGANPLDINAGRNGGIRVHGWERGDVVVRSRVQASAATEADARRLAASVRIETAGGSIHAEGPDTSGREEGWSVSFDVSVPRNAMLTL